MPPYSRVWVPKAVELPYLLKRVFLFSCGVRTNTHNKATFDEYTTISNNRRTKLMIKQPQKSGCN